MDRDRTVGIDVYQEHVPKGPWRWDLVCAWTSVTGRAGAHRGVVVPDGCADLLWSSTGGLVVVGPMTRPVTPSFPKGTAHAALRLRPGHAPRVLGVPASALTDLTVPAADVLGEAGRRLAERLDEDDGQAARVARLMALPELAPAADTDARVLEALAWLIARPARRVEQAADHVGLSSRQLQRRVVTAVGYGPKRFQRVVRVQRVLAAGPAALGDLARLSAELGFVDQAHLNREVLALAGRSPTRALAHGRATLTSETSKRPEGAAVQTEDRRPTTERQGSRPCPSAST
ncbi:MAG: helix-turn-helix transcriptional regulator [Euzebyales bacterium]|nr:helix-turn-helix transcriptional regulator [Euzebyales bacterium]